MIRRRESRCFQGRNLVRIHWVSERRQDRQTHDQYRLRIRTANQTKGADWRMLGKSMLQDALCQWWRLHRSRSGLRLQMQTDFHRQDPDFDPYFPVSFLLKKSGRQCQRPRDQCHPNPCQHKGQCVMDDLQGFVCKCRDNFFGRLCEKILPINEDKRYKKRSVP